MRVLALLIALGFAGPRLTAHADPAEPRVSIIQARKVALGRVPGTIVNEKLKTKHGKPAIWSIKIRPRGVAERAGRLTKIEVDAGTAAVVKVKDVKARTSED